jgi:hypothetical protein
MLCPSCAYLDEFREEKAEIIWLRPPFRGWTDQNDRLTKVHLSVFVWSEPSVEPGAPVTYTSFLFPW